jgi:hypothetical protein
MFLQRAFSTEGLDGAGLASLYGYREIGALVA